MQNSTPSAAGKNAVIISAVRDNSVDRTALKNAGVSRLRAFGSGREALDAIAAKAGLPFTADCVILTEQLEDMKSEDFLKELARLEHERGHTPPVLAICADERGAANALALGAGAVLVRPYTTGAMNAALTELSKRTTADERGRTGGRAPLPAPCMPDVAAKPAADEKAEREDGINPLLYRRAGLAKLHAGRPREAEELLRAALEYDSLDLEAAEGLARARLEQGDHDGSERWRHRAACICLESGQTERAARLLAGLPHNNDDPYLTEAKYLLKEKRYDQAVEVFLQAYLRQNAHPLHLMISRASQFMDAPEQAMLQMCRAFSRKGYSTLAGDMSRRFFGGAGDISAAGHGGMAAFTFLQEAWAVARYTFRAFRSASV